MIKKCMQHILGHCINRDRQTPDIGTPPSVCTVRLALSSPPLPSSTFDANYTICPPSISWDRTMPVFSLSLNLHTLLGTHMHSVPLFERCATTPLTELQTGSLSSLLGLEIAPPESICEDSLSASSDVAAYGELQVDMRSSPSPPPACILTLSVTILVILPNKP